MSEGGRRPTAPLAADGPQDPDRRRDGILSHTLTHTPNRFYTHMHARRVLYNVHVVVTQPRGQTKVLSLISGCAFMKFVHWPLFYRCLNKFRIAKFKMF